MEWQFRRGFLIPKVFCIQSTKSVYFELTSVQIQMLLFTRRSNSKQHYAELASILSNISLYMIQ